MLEVQGLSPREPVEVKGQYAAAGAGACEVLGLGALGPWKGDGDRVPVFDEGEGACGTRTGEGARMAAAGDLSVDTGEGERPVNTGDGADT